MARMYDAAAEEKIIDLCAYRSVRALTRAAGGEEMALPHARLAARGGACDDAEEACAGWETERLGRMCFRVAAACIAAAALALARTPGAVVLAFLFAAAAGLWEHGKAAPRAPERRRRARTVVSFTNSHSCEFVKKA